MNKVNQSNFNLEVERKVNEMTTRTTKRIVIAMVVVLFLVLLYGSVMDVKITINTLVYAITPVPVIGLIVLAYIDKSIRPIIEVELASSIGYNEAQMERVLKNPNYREHSASQ